MKNSLEKLLLISLITATFFGIAGGMNLRGFQTTELSRQYFLANRSIIESIVCFILKLYVSEFLAGSGFYLLCVNDMEALKKSATVE